MNKRNPLKPFVGVICAAMVLLATIVAVKLDSILPEPIFGIFQTEPKEELQDSPEDEATSGEEEVGENTESDGESHRETRPSDEDEDEDEEILMPPDDQPPVVDLPSESDPETGEQLGVSFPCQVPGYGLYIEKLAPYSGMFVEDGSNANGENVAMLLVSNDGDFPVEYTQIRVTYGEEEFLFDISALPVGEKLVVQEKTGKALSGDGTVAASALVVQRADMEMSEDKVRVIDNGDNTLTIQNLTGETIPTVRVFYKYYMDDQKLFVGGIAFTARITRLGPGASVTIQPSHYTSQTSRVVMVLTYDSEV